MEQPEIKTKDIKQVIVVTMSTGLQGRAVVKYLSEKTSFKIKALTRNPSSEIALELSKLTNVDVIQADLLDVDSLCNCFKGAYGIFGNTTPTKGWQPLVREYEMEQGRNLINAVSKIKKQGQLKHFVFSSICKAKDPIKNDPAPGHFSSKWDIEDYLFKKDLKEITTIIRPSSYFENFEGNLPGLKLSKNSFPGIVNPDKKWQTIAVKDIGLWTTAIFSNPNKFINKSINLAGEELTGNQMAKLLKKVLGVNSKKVNYIMAPRIFLKLFVNDIGLMADWIERAGYGADLNYLKMLAEEEGIKMTSLETWLKTRLQIQKN